MHKLKTKIRAYLKRTLNYFEKRQANNKAVLMKALIINMLGIAFTGALYAEFRIAPLLVTGILPIILSTWFYGKQFAVYSFIFMFFGTGGVLNLTHSNLGLAYEIVGSTVPYGLGVGVGIVLRSLKEMGNKIKELNKELCMKNDELQEAALKDPMTNLHNRRYVKEFITEYASTFLKQQTTPEFALRDVQIDDKVILLMIVDIDHFKKINDTYGHVVGDEVIIESSRRLCNAVRFDDKVTRWGGEEFLIICPMVLAVNVDAIISKVLDSVRSTPIILSNGASVNITVSLGAVWLPTIKASPFAVSFDDCIHLADNALYEVKENGRNHGRLVVSSPNAVDECSCLLPENMDDFYASRKCCSIVTLGSM